MDANKLLILLRTRIRDGMRQGPNFAGEYSIIQIGCGTGCSFVIVANDRTGEPFKFPLGGEGNMYLTLKYQLDSHLLVAQSGDFDLQKCFLEYIDFKNGEWSSLLKRAVGPLDACYNSIDANIQ